MTRWVLLAAVLLGPSIAGCVRTPKDLCQDYVDSLNDMVMRCELSDGRPLDISWPDGRVGCEHTAQVTDAQAIVQRCMPWAETVACSDLEFSGDQLVLDASCNPRTFRAYGE